MVPVSIVIITKNEADIVASCIHKSRLITDDIVVIDNGSTDDTLDIAGTYGCRVYKKTWDGYGANKNKGIEAAKYDWILSIDADEVPDEELIKSLHKLNLADPAIVYDIKFKSYFGQKPIHFGSWGRDHHVRLFNRNLVKWSETMVHETLLLTENIQIKKINGHLHHYSVKDIGEYDSKGIYYAKLSAKKYFRIGKRANFIKLYASPIFGFLKNYIVYLGFLDGREGWNIAKTTIKNTYRKYYYLSQLENQRNKKQPVKDSFAVEYNH
jgi:glycosyltransferase involved in cell wall biosynthesis